MKKFTVSLIVFALAFVASAKAQFIDRSALPAAVDQQFVAAYSSVTAPEWQKTGSKYTVTFTTDSVSHQLIYDKDGKIASHQYSIPLSSLPAEVSTSVEKSFADLKISAADKVEEDGKVKYLVTLGDNAAPVKVLTTDKGMVIKTITSDIQ